MAIVGDNEHLRHVDRIRAIAFREARDAGASFITRAWVSTRLKRSERFVIDIWNKDPYETAMDKANIGLGGKKLSLQSLCGERAKAVRAGVDTFSKRLYHQR